MTTIAVENPATGEVIGTRIAGEIRPAAGGRGLARAQESGMMAELERPSLAGASSDFSGRGAVMRRAQRWMLDNAERVIGAVIEETGKTYEDAQATDFG